MELFVLAVGSVLIGTVIGGIVSRLASIKAAFLTALGLFVVAAVLAILGEQTPGWDGLGYSIVATILVTPLAVGTLLVALIALVFSRR